MKVKLRLRTNIKEKDSMRPRYDTAKLEEDDVRKAFTIALKNRFEILEGQENEEDIEREFSIMAKA